MPGEFFGARDNGMGSGSGQGWRVRVKTLTLTLTLTCGLLRDACRGWNQGVRGGALRLPMDAYIYPHPIPSPSVSVESSYRSFREEDTCVRVVVRGGAW